MDIFYSILLISVCSVLTLAASFKLFKILQLSNYRVKGVWEWFKATRFDYPVRYLALGFLSFTSMFVYIGCFGRFKYVEYLGILFYIFFASLFVFFTRREHQKTPIHYTPRMIRLILITAFILIGINIGVWFLSQLFKPSYALLGVIAALLPLIVALSHYIALPFEHLNNLRYCKKAHKKLLKRDSPLKIIGITGSYGKTTTKNILAAMLEKKYNVLKTPGNYNTAMGLCKTVNNLLKPEHEVLIVEMGARYLKDIRAICKIGAPDYAIITAIGNQHLETFKTLENLKNCKFELIEGLKNGGFAVFNAETQGAVQLYERTQCQKALIQNKTHYDNIALSIHGTSFDLKLDGQYYNITTKLLGKHIASLCAICAELAQKLGLEVENIKSAIEQLKPIEHRLELIENADNPLVTVIDDAYNSNPEGANNALDVLKEFNCIKVIITPGFVELGAIEKDANTALGKKIAQCADYAFLIGSRAKFIKDGALQGNMDESKVLTFDSLNAAVKALNDIQGERVVLFENDLPDNVT